MEQLVVVVIFLLLSLLGGALKKKPPQGEDGVPLPAPDGEDATFRPAPQRRAPAAEDDPFAGWGVWPDQEQEEETEEVLVGWDDPVPPSQTEPARRAPAAAPAPAPLPAPVTVRPPDSRAWERGMQVAPAPVVRSLEREVDRAAEHRRFHDTIDRVPPPDEEPARSVLTGLRKPATLREAVLLAEVIGPPRAVRPFGNLPLG